MSLSRRPSPTCRCGQPADFGFQLTLVDLQLDNYDDNNERNQTRAARLCAQCGSVLMDQLLEQGWFTTPSVGESAVLHRKLQAVLKRPPTAPAAPAYVFCEACGGSRTAWDGHHSFECGNCGHTWVTEAR